MSSIPSHKPSSLLLVQVDVHLENKRDFKIVKNGIGFRECFLNLTAVAGISAHMVLILTFEIPTDILNYFQLIPKSTNFESLQKVLDKKVWHLK
jgi:hypothetical protein